MLRAVVTRHKKGKRHTGKFLKVIGVLITLIVLMISWVYAYVKMHQIVYIEYMQLFVYNF